MIYGGAARVVVAGVASAVVAFVATVAVVAEPTGTASLYATLFVWVTLVAAFAAANAEAERIPRFAAVFCGSLVGLSLLFGAVVDYRLLDVGLDGVPAADVGLAVNPVMAVLVGGALALSYYGVFELGQDGNGGRAV